jgi:dTDP-D-glucose 4,6-dehydratase
VQVPPVKIQFSRDDRDEILRRIDRSPLGWAAEIDLETGVRRTVDWYTREVLAAPPAPGGGA